MEKSRIIEKLKVNPIRKHFILGLVILFILFIFVFFSNSGLYKRFELEFTKSDKEILIQEKKKEIEKLEYQENKLLVDTTQIEKTAREKYGYVKDGETEYIISE